jgi:signal transduction histidine kinase
MHNLLFDYYLTRFGILVLFLACSAVAALYWVIRKRWQGEQKALKQQLAECQTMHFQKLHNYFHRIVAHEYGKGLNYILNKSTETLEGLGKEQTALRDKQDGIIVKTHELTQHAMNILYVFADQPEKPKKELLNIRQLVESVLLELFPYAESQGVTLRPSLEDIEPLILDRDLTVLAIRNLIHNAIKYSERGRVVEIILTIAEDEMLPGKEIGIFVKDRGQGIKNEDKVSMFDLNVRGDGLIETGNGLGLYCARKAARFQGGDVILVSSSPNQGSVFKITLPFAMPEEIIQETKWKQHLRTEAVLRWGFAIIVLLVLAALLIYTLKPPKKVAILSFHGQYVTAMGEDEGWLLTQEPEVSACGRFTQFNLGKGKIALLTCYGRYVTAPRSGNERPELVLWQDSGLSNCGQFDLVELANGKVAFKTCTGMVFTAGDGGWDPGLQWLVVAETKEIRDWEKFTLQPQR